MWVRGISRGQCLFGLPPWSPLLDQPRPQFRVSCLLRGTRWVGERRPGSWLCLRQALCVPPGVLWDSPPLPLGQRSGGSLQHRGERHTPGWLHFLVSGQPLAAKTLLASDIPRPPPPALTRPAPSAMRSFSVLARLRLGAPPCSRGVQGLCRGWRGNDVACDSQ